MSTLCSAWNIFFPLFSAWIYFIYFGIYYLFIFSVIFFIFCLFITSILSNKQIVMSSVFHCYDSRVTMCESILKILSIFTFFPDITYETLLRMGCLKRKKAFYLIWCWFIFFYLIDKGFCPSREFVFCNKLDKIRRQNYGAKVA